MENEELRPIEDCGQGVPQDVAAQPDIRNDEQRNGCDRPMKHLIQIEPLDYGYVVTVGCQKFAIETHQDLIKKLAKYFESPQDAVSLWLGEGKFKT